MTDNLIIDIKGRVGQISLNRPKAIHALNLEMCLGMIDALLSWQPHGDIDAVMIDHHDGRGFCAGGDIRMLATSGAGDGVEAKAFFMAEYRLNHLMHEYDKPIVTFMDGITMGGGVGISQPARYRIATENTRFAMPETGIGLFPDVGAGWFLPRLQGRTGVFLALTGARLDGAECFALGLATHYLPSDNLAEAKRQIADKPDQITPILDALSVTPPPARIMGNMDQINRLFASDRYEDILAALDADGSEWAAKERQTLNSKSPQTCKVALRQLAEGAKMPDFAAEMKQEYMIGAHVVQMHDFIEGVRALIIDKDNKPMWNPATAEDVSDALIDQIFTPLPTADAWTPLE